VTLEDHNIYGGLGSAVAEVIAEREPACLVRLGLQDVFAESGEAEALLDHFQMAVSDVADAVRKVIARKQMVGKRPRKTSVPSARASRLGVVRADREALLGAEPAAQDLRKPC
jgi:hypothetical protein